MSLSLAMRVVQLAQGNVDAAQAAGAVQLRAVDVVLDRQGGAEARPARRVELLDEIWTLRVACSAVTLPAVAARPSTSSLGIEQRQGDGEGAVDAGVGDDDDLACHDFSRGKPL